MRVLQVQVRTENEYEHTHRYEHKREHTRKCNKHRMSMWMRVSTSKSTGTSTRIVPIVLWGDAVVARCSCMQNAYVGPRLWQARSNAHEHSMDMDMGSSNTEGMHMGLNR